MINCETYTQIQSYNETRKTRCQDDQVGYWYNDTELQWNDEKLRSGWSITRQMYLYKDTKLRWNKKIEINCDTDTKIQNYNETKKSDTDTKLQSCNEIRKQMWPGW